MNKQDYLLPQWAGYDAHGNDRNGHMHFYPNGPFIRADGKRGYFCAAPLDDNGGCSDPIPFEDRQITLTEYRLEHAPTGYIVGIVYDEKWAKIISEAYYLKVVTQDRTIGEAE